MGKSGPAAAAPHPRDVVIVEGVRTPFAKADTKLKTVHPAELGRVALKELLARTILDVNLVDEVIIGNTGNPSDAVNIGRVVALNAGIPQKTSAHTVHRNCASAMESIAGGFDKIKAGMANVVISGGTESMSQMPLIYSNEVGDWYDYVSLRDGRFGIIVGDVSGKGMGPAMVATEARAIVRSLLIHTSDIGEILTSCNRLLLNDLSESRFVTMFFAVVDPVDRTMTYGRCRTSRVPF